MRPGSTRPGINPVGRPRRRLRYVLATGLAGAMAVTAPASAGASVDPAPSVASAESITVSGHGYGHGRGLGQYGAYGYAETYGWTSRQILDHYYSNTTAATLPAGTRMSVRLLAQDGADLVVTSPTAFTVAGLTIAGGSTGRLSRSGTQWTLHTSYGCGQGEVWSTPVGTAGSALSPELAPTVASPGFDADKMLALCEGTTRHSYRGTLRLATDAGALRTVNTLGLDEYVMGVVPQESPASWPAAALQAQAVAARSFSMAENRYSYAKTCDSTSCQVYRGYSKGATAYEAASTSNATGATANQVRMLNGVAARTEFSSSTGGYSAGGTFPAVPDAGDAIAANKLHNWQVTLDPAAVASTYGVGTFRSIAVVSRNGLGAGGGRSLSLQVVGSAKTVTVSAASFRTAFGLKSDWFDFGSAPPVVSGPATFYVRHATTTGAANAAVEYGDPASIPLMCDWNGDGTDTQGSFRNGAWNARNSLSAGGPDVTFAFGAAGDIPVCGDWNGDGTDTPGVVRGRTWLLRNANSNGGVDISLSFGDIGDRPVVGDWNNDGSDTVGVVRSGMWYFRNTNSTGVGDVALRYGDLGDGPVVGDWNGDGYDSPGVIRAGTWYLRNSVTSGAAELPAFRYGDPTDHRFLAADADGNGTDGPVIARNFVG